MTARVEAIQPVRLADEDEEAGNTEPGKLTALLADLERWTAEAAELRDSLEALLEAVEGASWRDQFATQELEGSAEPFDRLGCWEELSADPTYESEAALMDALTRFSEACAATRSAADDVQLRARNLDTESMEEYRTLDQSVFSLESAVTAVLEKGSKIERLASGLPLEASLSDDLSDLLADISVNTDLSSAVGELRGVTRLITESAPISERDKRQLAERYNDIRTRIREVEHGVRMALEWQYAVAAGMTQLSCDHMFASLAAATGTLCYAASMGRQPAGLELATDISTLEGLQRELSNTAVIEPRVRAILLELTGVLDSLTRIGRLFVAGAAPEVTYFPSTLRMTDRGWVAGPRTSGTTVTYEIDEIPADARTLQLFARDAAGRVIASATLQQGTPFIAGQWIQFQVDVDVVHVLSARVQSLA